MLNSSRLTFKYSEVLFFMAYGIFLVLGVLKDTFFYGYFAGIPFYCMCLLIIIILACKEIVSNNRPVQNIATMLIYAFAVLIALKNLKGGERVFMITMFVLIYCSWNIPFKRIVQFSLVELILLLSFVVCSAQVGIIQNYVSYRASRGTYRYYLGFRYSLYAPALYFNIVSLILYLRRKKISLIEIAVLSAINIVLFVATDSRLSFGLTLLLLLVCYVAKFIKIDFSKKNVVNLGVMLSFIICFTMSLLLSALYDSTNPVLHSLNNALGNRLALGNRSLIENGLNLFGKHIQWIGNGLTIEGTLGGREYNYVDSAYISILQKYGAVFMALLLIGFTVCIYEQMKKNNVYGVIVLSIIAGHAIVDDLIVSIAYNTFIFVLPAAIGQFRDEKSVSKRKKCRIKFKFRNSPHSKLIKQRKIYGR